MTQKITQFRYFGDGDPRNFPQGLTANNLGSTTFISSQFDRSSTTITYIKISCPICLKVYLEMKSNGSVCEYQIADSGLLELKGIYCSNFWFELNKLRYFSTTFRKAVQGVNGVSARNEFADPRLIIDIYYED